MVDRKKPQDDQKKVVNEPFPGGVFPGAGGGSVPSHDDVAPLSVSQGDAPKGPRKVPGGGTPYTPPSGTPTESDT
ncbi:hypothetical protein [Roseibium alexandrii]|jgi:hypothetical protein|uniref:Uncharacterized protein n=1 Tax=Roseibium alexandrii TaxID=388408 RepID=A0A0M7AMN2_9HYPH|nr:hypothetical protein [Roseibium alexandrii]CTQ75781.1 hypothetical protein LAX5112_04357 [Roseibium alexandrii]